MGAHRAVDTVQDREDQARIPISTPVRTLAAPLQESATPRLLNRKTKGRHLVHTRLALFRKLNRRLTLPRYLRMRLASTVPTAEGSLKPSRFREHRGQCGAGWVDVVPEQAMSLSVASSAAAYGKPLGYGLAGLSTAPAPGGGSPQRPGVAPSWSWTPLDRIRTPRCADGGPVANTGSRSRCRLRIVASFRGST